jgi:ketol-acid reductoisomerase
MRTFEVGGVKETVVERSDYPLAKVRQILKDEKILVIGYGPQGRAQSLNLRDNGMNVLVCNRRDANYDLAKKEGWKEGKTLLDNISEAVKQATIVLYLLNDAAQKQCWSQVGPCLQPGSAIYFSHGFSIVYRDQTGVVPAKNVDVILVAPKGSGTTVRRLFQAGRGINCSFAVHQDATGHARERCIAVGIGIGCGFLFETTFEKEVFSDLVGERGVLMGAIQGIFKAQYDLLRAKGHSPAEAFNETVEEGTQSLYPLIGENGMDWMFSNCSATAQRGALDWWAKFAEAVKPVFASLYEEVASGRETAHVLDCNGRPSYVQDLRKDLDAIDGQEMWQIGKIVRELRPERQKVLKPAAKKAKPVAKKAKPAAKKAKPKAKAKKAGKSKRR